MCAVAVIPRWLSGSHSYKRVGREGERERIGREGKGGRAGKWGICVFLSPSQPTPRFPANPAVVVVIFLSRHPTVWGRDVRRRVTCHFVLLPFLWQRWRRRWPRYHLISPSDPKSKAETARIRLEC